MSAFSTWTLTGGLLLGLMCLGTQTASAAHATITARVEGGKIVNTTPKAQLCGQFAASTYCGTRTSVDVWFSYSKPVNLSSTNDRDKVYIHLPSRQTLILTNQNTGQTASMDLQFDQISQKVTWQSQAVVGFKIKGGCNRDAPLLGGPNFSRYLWWAVNPTTQRACIADVPAKNEDVQNSQFSEMGVIYTANFPDASSLGPGVWTADIQYPIGIPGKGFDFGNFVQPSSSTIDFRIEIQVQHDMQVDLPASGGEVELLPPGGWQQYANTNKVPERLFHDSPLKVWAASSFAVYLYCQYRNDTGCAIGHPGQSGLSMPPLVTALSLPGPFSHNGQPVSRLMLEEGVRRAKIITPSGNVSGQTGTVHFDLLPGHIKPMLSQRGAKYSGNVTLVFDANP